MPSVANEWVGSHWVKHASLALYAGLIVGASFWGCSCDIVGRKLAWNSTLFIGGAFGLAAGAAPNFPAFCTLIAFTGFGVGGNLPVDGTMFLEFMPSTHQWLLTLLSIWWAIGQVVASLIAWGFMARWGCQTPPEGTYCRREDNMGWRYTYFTLGAMMIFFWVARIFILPVYESPKFLSSIGKDREAVAIIHKLAKRNGKTTDLTLEDLRRAAAPYLTDDEKAIESGNVDVETKFSNWELLKNSFDEIKGDSIKTLFANKRIAWSTSLIVLCYALVGFAYPLYNGFLGAYLNSKLSEEGTTSLDETYKAYTYQAACGVPGSFAAAALVQWSRAGRKFAMAFFTAGAGVVLFGLTQSKNNATVNALTSIAAFFQNAFYGVLFGYAPELFPTPVRGTGDALCAAANRVTGFMAPVIAIYSKASETPDGPVFASASVFVVTGVIMCFLPVETYGKAAL